MFSSYTDPVDIPHDGYERLGIRSHAKGTFHSYVPAGHELQTAQMHRVAANKFIVNITFGWEHAVAVTDENDAGKLVSHRFPQFSLSDELDPQFLKFIILDERFRHHLWLASPGGAGRNRVLNLNQMLQYEIQIPCVAEQLKIAGALINIDTLITLHQREESCAASFSASCFGTLKAFFWEQRKFSDMAETRRGLTYSPSSIRVSGIRVLRSSNIAEDQFAYSEDDVFVAPDAVKIPFANQGDILITSANGSTRLVGKHTIIRDIPMNSAVHGGFMLLATAQNPEFVNALMSAPWYAKFISLFVAGGNGAIGNLNKNDLDEQDVLVPEDAEQRIIGQYFSQLDRLITLHQCKPKSRKGGSHVLYSYQV